MRHAERDDAGEPRDDVERIGVGRLQRVEHEGAVADLTGDRSGDGIGVVTGDLVAQRVRERKERHPGERPQADARVHRTASCRCRGAQEHALADACGARDRDRSALAEQGRGTVQLVVAPDKVSFQRCLAAWVKDGGHSGRFRRLA